MRENFSSPAGYLFNFSEYGEINLGNLPPQKAEDTAESLQTGRGVLGS
jgi:hypothetical protein